MSTNISKKKRDDLLDKIKQIRAFIAAAPQDENTGNLLSYLYELEKDVNGKKYGLVFEEHREEIDEVLDTHTPVLTEDADLFIDHGGQMNFLLEGDNLAALKLLEKTHRGKIDLIYIDPPYNTGNKDFIYDDAFVDKTDGFIHSKWITLKCIIDYLNEQFKKFNEDGNDPYHYTIESQIMPGEDFLSSIKRAKTMSVLKLTVYKDDIKDGFMRFAGRTDIADEVDICLKRPKGYKCFPENLIKEYFKDSQDKAKGKIKRIKIIGTNDAGSFEVDTNITGMKHFLKVKGESVTNEVESSDFFVKAQEFIASMGGRI